MPKRKDEKKHDFPWTSLAQGFAYHTARFSYLVERTASQTIKAAAQGVKSGPSTVVKVLDNSMKNAKGHPIWFMRVDTRGGGKINPHLNVNSRITKALDPHTPISNGFLQASPKVAGTMSAVSKGLTFVAIAVDTIKMGFSFRKDVQHGSSRNTVTTAATVAGGWGGGLGGGMAGAAIGSAIFPGIGTLVGSIAGGVAGAIGISNAAGAATEAIADATNYDIVEKWCKLCGKGFKIRKYQGDKEKASCDDCYVELLVFEDPRGNVLFLPNSSNVEKIAEWERDFWPRLVAYICGDRPEFLGLFFANDEEIQIDTDNEKLIVEKDDDGDFYASMGPQNWNESDYEKLLNHDYGFVESDAWIYFSPENVHCNPLNLFEKVFVPLYNGELPLQEYDVECVGRVEKGSGLLWHKPNKEQFEVVKRNVEELAAELKMELTTKYL